MILKAAQRGGAAQLAAHLLNAHDNEHVEIHEISGFLAETLPEALQEIQALSRGTRCRQFMFSVSLNPPPGEDVTTANFEDAARRIEEKTGLSGQPRAIIFHEKQGRRHAHAVWSRIDGDNMKAINLPYFKNKMMEVSKALYLEHGWKLPAGLIDRERRNPLNFSREEWQQAGRIDMRPETVKAVLKECWAVSDGRKSFAGALEEKGFALAKGDRRGFVAVDFRGEVYSFSRWLDVKTKALKERLGKRDDLPGAEEAKAAFDQKLAARMETLSREIRDHYAARLTPLKTQKTSMKERHAQERSALKKRQNERWEKDVSTRQAQLRKGIMGLWDRLTGKHGRIKREHEQAAAESLARDRDEKDTLITRQLQERHALQKALNHLQKQQDNDLSSLQSNIFSNLQSHQIQSLQQKLKHHPQGPNLSPGL